MRLACPSAPPPEVEGEEEEGWWFFGRCVWGEGGVLKGAKTDGTRSDIRMGWPGRFFNDFDDDDASLVYWYNPCNLLSLFFLFSLHLFLSVVLVWGSGLMVRRTLLLVSLFSASPLISLLMGSWSAFGGPGMKNNDDLTRGRGAWTRGAGNAYNISGEGHDGEAVDA